MNTRLLSFRASYVCQPRVFSQTDGVYHLDGGFLSLVLGSYALTIMCRRSMMSYSGSKASNIIIVPNRVRFFFSSLLSIVGQKSDSARGGRK